MPNMPNFGHQFLAACDSCLHLWVDNEPAKPDDQLLFLGLMWSSTKDNGCPVRTRPRCIAGGA